MGTRAKLTAISGAALAVFLLVQPGQAYADWGWGWGHRDRHEHYRVYHPYPVFGRAVLSLSAGFVDVVIGGSRYYYSDGVYYRHDRNRYIVVAPPVGATITEIPAGFQQIVVNGNTYYVSDGIYYQYTPQGYLVVNQPVVAPPPVQAVVVVPAPAQPTAPAAADDSFTVNIPDGKGGYTPVVIRKSGNGFVGPQGEFYAQFPRVEQLKAMYVK